MTTIQALVGALLLVVGVAGWWNCLRMTLVADVVPVLIGGGLTLLVGVGAPSVVKKGDVQIPYPEADKDKYRAILDFGDRQAGAWLGLLERLFFFSTIWVGQPVGVAAWFALKVAAKWNAWSHIAKVPANFPDDTIDGVRFRRLWSAHVLNRFLIGILYNVLCGVAGAAAGWLIVRSLATGGPR